MCPYEKEAESSDTEEEVSTEAETGVTQPQAKDAWRPWKLEGARNEFPPGVFGGSIALPTP